MGKKFIALSVDPLLNGVSMASSINGTPVPIQDLDNIGIQCSWTGSDPLGTLGVQVSVDYSPQFGTGTWTPLDNGGTPISISPGGSAGNGYFDLNQLSASWVQVTYTTASGSSGSLTVKYSAKAV